MVAELIEGKPIAERMKQEVKSAVENMPEPPKLVSVLATNNPGARYYAKSQQKACGEVGIEYELHDTEIIGDRKDTESLQEYIQQLNSDRTVTGILQLMPLPDNVDGRAVQREIAPEKDVEGIHPANIGRLFYGDFSLSPCTARAVIIMLEDFGIDLEGKETVVIGHSEIVGKPSVVMLLRSVMHSPTVTCCHIATKDLTSHTKRAEVLIVAAGKAGLVNGEMLKKDSVVVDVGINRIKVEEGGKKKTKVVGDVDFDSAKEIAAAITPVPGGVGLVTTAMLLNNIIECARRQ